MDFIIANSADPDEMTHCVAFHLGLPCSIKYPIRGFTTDQIRYSFYCGSLSPFLSNDDRFKRRFQQFPYLSKVTPLAAMFLRDQVCFICFVVRHRGILFNSDD